MVSAGRAAAAGAPDGVGAVAQSGLFRPLNRINFPSKLYMPYNQSKLRELQSLWLLLSCFQTWQQMRFPAFYYFPHRLRWQQHEESFIIIQRFAAFRFTLRTRRPPLSICQIVLAAKHCNNAFPKFSILYWKRKGTLAICVHLLEQTNLALPRYSFLCITGISHITFTLDQLNI